MASHEFFKKKKKFNRCLINPLSSKHSLVPITKKKSGSPGESITLARILTHFVYWSLRMNHKIGWKAVIVMGLVISYFVFYCILSHSQTWISSPAGLKVSGEVSTNSLNSLLGSVVRRATLIHILWYPSYWNGAAGNGHWLKAHTASQPLRYHVLALTSAVLYDAVQAPKKANKFWHAVYDRISASHGHVLRDTSFSP